MPVLFLASWFPTRIHPTHGNFVEKHARTVAATHELVVVTIQADPALPIGRFELEEDHSAPFGVIRVYFGQSAKTPSWRRLYLRAIAWQKGIRAATTIQGQPSIVHAHVLLDAGVIAAIHQLFTRIPFVVTEHSTAYWSKGNLPGIRGALVHWAARRATCLMPVTEALGQRMRSNYQLKGNYHPVSNVVDTDLFNYLPPPPKRPFKLLHISNFRDEQKNISGILRAYKMAVEQSKVPLQLTLAGDGDFSDYQSSSVELGLDTDAIEFSGPHSEAAVAELMQSCHAFVLFSRVETQSVVVIEALAAGRPCIVTPVADLEKTVGKTSGLIVVQENEEQLCEAILEMVDNYELYDGNQIRTQVLDLCSAEAVAQAFTTIYQQATSKNNRA